MRWKDGMEILFGKVIFKFSGDGRDGRDGRGGEESSDLGGSLSSTGSVQVLTL